METCATQQRDNRTEHAHTRQRPARRVNACGACLGDARRSNVRHLSLTVRGDEGTSANFRHHGTDGVDDTPVGETSILKRYQSASPRSSPLENSADIDFLKAARESHSLGPLLIAPGGAVAVMSSPSGSAGIASPASNADRRRAVAKESLTAVWKQIEPDANPTPTMSFSQHKMAYIPPAPGTTPTKHRRRTEEFTGYIDKALRLNVDLKSRNHE